jgi:hypothetical protein
MSKGAHSSLAQMQSQSMQHNQSAELTKETDQQVNMHRLSRTGEIAALGDDVDTGHIADKQKGRHLLQMASMQMHKLSDGVSDLRNAVRKLDRDVGLSASVRHHNEKDGTNPFQKAAKEGKTEMAKASDGTSAMEHKEKASTNPFQKAAQKVKVEKAAPANAEDSRAKLHSLNVKSMVGSLEAQMKKQFDHFTSDDSSQSNLDSVEHAAQQEKEIEELERGTNNILNWMGEIKKLKMERGELHSVLKSPLSAQTTPELAPKARLDETNAVTKNALASPAAPLASRTARLDEMNTITKSALSHPTAPLASRGSVDEVNPIMKSPLSAPTAASVRLPRSSHVYGPHLETSAFIELLQNRNLSEELIKSSIEMMQIKRAAEEVMSGVEKLAEWKQRADGSAESSEEASLLKARLSKALHFLEGHESLISRRANELNSLLESAADRQDE